MGRIKNLDQSHNKTKKIPKRFQKKCSTSLSMLLTTGAYKKRIKDLLKNNKNLASELEKARSQVAAQQETLKDYVRDSNQMMYAREKLKDIAIIVHQLATDLEMVTDFLEVSSELKNVKYIEQFSEDGFHHQNWRMKIEDPAVSRIEESVSVEGTPTAGTSAIDAASENSHKPDNSPILKGIEEHFKSTASGVNLNDSYSPSVEPRESQLSLTPVLHIQPIVHAVTCAANRNSRMSLKNAITKVSEDLHLKKTPEMLIKKSNKKESSMHNFNNLLKIQKKVGSPSKVITQQVNKLNVLPYNKPKIFNRAITFDPVDSAVDDTSSVQKLLLSKNKYMSLATKFKDAPLHSYNIDKTIRMCEDMELTDVISTVPTIFENSTGSGIVTSNSAENNFHPKTSSSANTVMKSKDKNDKSSEYETEVPSELKNGSNVVLPSKIEKQNVLENEQKDIASKLRIEISNDATLETDVQKSSSEQKRVTFSTTDSVYTFKRNSTLLNCDKHLIAQSAKSNVSSDIAIQENISLGLMEEKATPKKGKEEVLVTPKNVKNGQHSSMKTTNECKKNHAVQSKEIGQCLKDKTVGKIEHYSLLHHCATTHSETDLDDMTEIYTFVPSESQEVEKNVHVNCDVPVITMHGIKNYEYSGSFDVKNTDLQRNYVSKHFPRENPETNQLSDENSGFVHSKFSNSKSNSTKLTSSSSHAKYRVKNMKLYLNGKGIENSLANEHDKSILCSKVTTRPTSFKIVKSGTEETFNDDEDKSVTGLGSIMSQLSALKKIETNHEKVVKASKGKDENILAENILVSDKVEKSNFSKENISKTNTSENYVKQLESEVNTISLIEKNDSFSKRLSDPLKFNMKGDKKKSSVKKKQIAVKANPECHFAVEKQKNSMKESRITQEVKKLSCTHSAKDMNINDENLPTPRSSMTNGGRPRRPSKPVNYKEPCLNKKMRRV